MAGRLVSPDIMFPGGIVNRKPGLRAIKSVVVTMRSLLVIARPIVLATMEYARKNTRAWKNTVVLSVPIL